MRRLMVLAASVTVLLSGVSASAVHTMQVATPGRWVIRDLGTLGGTYSTAVAINERGQVVGDARRKDKFSHAFLWQDGKMRDLGTLGGLFSTAVAINERGQVVGDADTKAKDKYGYEISHAFLWQDGKMRDVGTLGGGHSGAGAINDRAQIAGTSYTTSGKEHIVVWQNGRMRDLGRLPGGGHLYVSDINELGQVVGTAQGAQEYPYESRAFVSWGSKLRDLGTLGGKESWATAINDRRLVVGCADTKAKDRYGGVISHVFLLAERQDARSRH